MSYVIASPELMTAAAADLAGLQTTLSAAYAAVAPQTTAVAPAAADEVSASIARLFSEHGADYQKVAEQAAAFQEQLVQKLAGSALSYASAEATNVASLLQPLATAVGSVAAPAATALDTSLLYAGEIVRRLGVIMSSSTTSWKNLFQAFLTNPIGVVTSLPYIVSISAVAVPNVALYVLAPLGPLGLAALNPVINLIPTYAESLISIYSFIQPFVGPEIASLLLTPALLPVLIIMPPLLTLLLLQLAYSLTGGPMF